MKVNTGNDFNRLNLPWSIGNIDGKFFTHNKFPNKKIQ